MQVPRGLLEGPPTIVAHALAIGVAEAVLCARRVPIAINRAVTFGIPARVTLPTTLASPAFVASALAGAGRIAVPVIVACALPGALHRAISFWEVSLRTPVAKFSGPTMTAHAAAIAHEPIEAVHRSVWVALALGGALVQARLAADPGATLAVAVVS